MKVWGKVVMKVWGKVVLKVELLLQLQSVTEQWHLSQIKLLTNLLLSFKHKINRQYKKYEFTFLLGCPAAQMPKIKGEWLHGGGALVV